MRPSAAIVALLLVLSCLYVTVRSPHAQGAVNSMLSAALNQATAAAQGTGTSPGPGDNLPSFSLRDAGGDWHQELAAKHKVTVVIFWSSWCRSCDQQLRVDAPVIENYQGQLQVILVDVGESPTELDSYLAKHPLPWRTLLDDKLQVTHQFNVSYLPLMIVTAPGGRIVERLEGMVGTKELQYAIEEARHAGR